MSAAVRYTLYHPRWYRRRVSVWWWLKGGPYTLFVLRELTSVFVALFAAVLLWEARSVAEGPEAYARFFARMASPPFLALHSLGLLALLYHSITWFNLAPKAMVVRLGGRRVPDVAIAGANYAAWLVLSAIVAAILLRG